MVEFVSCTDSTMMRTLSYYSQQGLLVAEFKNKAMHAYSGVGKKDWQSVRDAESRGKAMNKHIIGRHPEIKLSKGE